MRLQTHGVNPVDPGEALTAPGAEPTASSPTTSTPPPTSTPWSGSSGDWVPVEQPGDGLRPGRRGRATAGRRAHTLPVSDVRAGDAGRLRRRTASRSRCRRPRPQAEEATSGSWSPTCPARSRRRCWCARSPSGCARSRPTGKKVLWVGGPAVVHTGAAPAMVALVEAGYVDVLFAGNALATHDIESALFGTSLGVDLAKGSRRRARPRAPHPGASTRSARPARSRPPSSPAC